MDNPLTNDLCPFNHSFNINWYAPAQPLCYNVAAWLVSRQPRTAATSLYPLEGISTIHRLVPDFILQQYAAGRSLGSFRAAGLFVDSAS